MEISQKTKNKNYYYVPLLDIYSEKKCNSKRHMYPKVLCSIFIIARTWKQSKCPPTDEWIKMWYIYTVEYYSIIKRNEIGSVLMRWMKQEPIIHSEVNQKEKHQYSILTHIYGI